MNGRGWAGATRKLRSKQLKTGQMSTGQMSARIWAAVIIVAAVIGGLAAADIAGAPALAALLVSLVVGAAAAFWAHVGIPAPEPGTDGPGRQERAWPDSWADRRTGPPPVTPRPTPAGPAEPAGTPNRTGLSPPGEDPAWGPDGLVQVMELPGGTSTGRSWWEKPAVTAGTPGAAPPPAPLSSYLDSAVVAQCPRCGSFGLEVRQGKAEWVFRCDACQHVWAWHPGVAWPAVEVRPRRRGAHRPPP